MAERTKILYELLIGKPLKLSKTMFIPIKNENDRDIILEEYFDRNDANAYVFTEHQITFKIKMSSSQMDANKASIKIFNLDDETVDYLITNQRNKLVVTLSAGDNVQGIKEIFNGTIEKVDINDRNENRIVALTVVDGITQITNAKSVRRWPRGTPYQQVISDLAKDMKVPIKTQAKVEGELNSPTTLVGPTLKLIRSQLARFGYEYSIDKGLATIIPRNKRQTKEVSYISKESGLIGKVSDYSDSVKDSANSKSDEGGAIAFSCFIDGNLAPNETVYIKDGKFDGAYKITDIDFSGNYEGNDWTCSVVAVETEGTIE